MAQVQMNEPIGPIARCEKTCSPPHCGMALVSSAYVRPTKKTMMPPMTKPSAAPPTPPVVIHEPDETTQPQPIMAPKAMTRMSHEERTLSKEDDFCSIAGHAPFKRLCGDGREVGRGR